MSVSAKIFGKTDKGEEVTLYRIENSKGMAAEVINYGANLVSLYVTDANGCFEDVVLGFDNVKDYTVNPSFFGSTIGRSANRIANARFTLNGVTYELEKNDGENNLHSHFDECFNKKLFSATVLDDNAVKFSVFSPDGDQGFPGNVNASVIYRVTEDNTLELEYEATTDADTIYNITNHTYFNLSGHTTGSAMDHELWLKASCYTPTVPGSIPTGEIATVKGTPFDFTVAKRIGDRIDEDNAQLEMAGGYDHNFAIDKETSGVELIARLSDPKSGRSMNVYTDLPGVQFYAGNFIATQSGKGGVTYGKRHAVCLETQFFPDAIHQPGFASPVLKAGETFHSITKYQFC